MNECPLMLSSGCLVKNSQDSKSFHNAQMFIPVEDGIAINRMRILLREINDTELGFYVL